MGSFVLLRLRAHRLLIAAVLLTILLTTSVLAALAGFTSSVGDAGVRRALQSTDAAGTPLVLQDTVDYQGRAQADATARSLSARAFAGLPVSINSLDLSDGYSLPVLSATDSGSDITHLASLDHSKVRLLSGSWPVPAASADSVVPVAVPLAAATRLGRDGAAVRIGAVLTLPDVMVHRSIRIRVTGVYQALNTGDSYWQLDSNGGKGAQIHVSGSFYGPLLIDDGSFRNGAVTQYSISWVGTADFSTLHAGGLDALSAANTAVANSLYANQDNPAARAGFTGSTELPVILSQLQRNLLVSRSVLLVSVLQLVLLATVTLLLTARLLAEERESENALLRARGAATRRLRALAAAEALLLVLPSAVLAPLLAEPLVRLLADHGPLVSSGVRLDAALPRAALWATLAGVLVSALVVLGPTLVRARNWTEHRQQRARRTALPGILRGGADIALVALAVLACWQLDHYAAGSGGSGALDTGSSGALSIDPVLVAAPTLALGAGAVLTLRLLPFAARGAEWLTSRTHGLPGALVGWQLSRRPQQNTGPVLALALAAAIGTLAVGQASSWHRSQLDQAAFDTPADIRVANADSPAFGQGGAFSGVPGVTTAVPVGRLALNLPLDRTGELIALDTRTEAKLLTWRSDLRSESVARLLAPLADRPLPAAQRGIPVPGRPSELSLDVTAGLQGRTVTQSRLTVPDDEVTVTVQDRYGSSYDLGPLSVPVDGARRTVSVDLDATAGGGTPAYPLTVTALSITSPIATAATPAVQDFTVNAIRGDAEAAVVPAGFSWVAHFAPGGAIPGPSAPNATTGPLGVYHPGTLDSYASDASTPLSMHLGTGTVGVYDSYVQQVPPTATTTFSVRQPDAASGPLPAVVTQQYLESTGTHVGSVVQLGSSAGDMDIRITAVVTAVPGTGSAAEQGLNGSTLLQGSGLAGSTASTEGGYVLVDLDAYNRRAAAATAANPLQPEEWWLYVRTRNGTADPAAESRAGAALNNMAGVQALFTQDQSRTALTSDPLGTGPEAALLAAVALAVVLAAIGFATDAAAITRRRVGENAVLTALGTPRRLIARSTAVQLALPTLVGVALGLLIGVVLTHLLVPVLVLTSRATRPVPSVLVTIPGGRLCLLLVAVTAVPLLIAALSGLRGGNPAQSLRQPEES